jgi:hypothetical protein
VQNDIKTKKSAQLFAHSKKMLYLCAIFRGLGLVSIVPAAYESTDSSAQEWSNRRTA